MIQIQDQLLPTRAQDDLGRWQFEIDAILDYASRVLEGKKKFKSRNRSDNRTFQDIRTTLARMCRGPRRCMYCEDSIANQIEHFCPKDLYPELVFVWLNYLYACGACNQPKNNKFRVRPHAGGDPVDVTRRPGDPVVPPRPGVPLLIDPRAEDPLGYLYLDLGGSMFFVPRYGLSSKERERVDYTIDVLGLNDREYLVEARRNAYEGYRDRLAMFILRRDQGASSDELKQRKASLLRTPHPTVWAEMKRQYLLIDEIRVLFQQAPETLVWSLAQESTTMHHEGW